MTDPSPPSSSSASTTRAAPRWPPDTCARSGGRRRGAVRRLRARRTRSTRSRSRRWPKRASTSPDNVPKMLTDRRGQANPMSSSRWAAATPARSSPASATRTGNWTTRRARASTTVRPIRDEIKRRVEALLAEILPARGLTTDGHLSERRGLPGLAYPEEYLKRLAGDLSRRVRRHRSTRRPSSATCSSRTRRCCAPRRSRHTSPIRVTRFATDRLTALAQAKGAHRQRRPRGALRLRAERRSLADGGGAHRPPLRRGACTFAPPARCPASDSNPAVITAMKEIGLDRRRGVPEASHRRRCPGSGRGDHHGLR